MSFGIPASSHLCFGRAPCHGGTNHSTQCSTAGILKFIGWSELYMSDACGKAFQALYDDAGLLGKAFDIYWQTVSTKFANKQGVPALIASVLRPAIEAWQANLKEHCYILNR